MKAYVHTSDCISCGLCTSTCPDVFEMNDENQSTVIQETVPHDAIEKAVLARDGCPVSIISLKN